MTSTVSEEMTQRTDAVRRKPATT